MKKRYKKFVGDDNLIGLAEERERERGTNNLINWTCHSHLPIDDFVSGALGCGGPVEVSGSSPVE